MRKIEIKPIEDIRLSECSRLDGSRLAVQDLHSRVEINLDLHGFRKCFYTSETFRKWLNSNIDGFYYINLEYDHDRIGIIFENEEDMVAFKLQFDGEEINAYA